ncbi:MAG: hypothetical protein ACTHOJ_04915 [Sphingomonas oligoaromativorans]
MADSTGGGRVARSAPLCGVVHGQQWDRPFTVGIVLGHASYQSTQQYSHLASDTLLAAVEAGTVKLNMKRADTPR